MHKLHNNKLPIIFRNKFTKIENIHSHKTRRSNKVNYFLPRTSKTAGQNKLNYRATKLWNEIDDNVKRKHFSSFKNLYKEKLIKEYTSTHD